MKTNKKKLPTRFAPATRFTVDPVEPVLARELLTAESAQLKTKLLRPLLETTENTELRNLFERVANEAEALAWTTTVPLLVLPALIEEKTRTAIVQAERQQSVRMRSLAVVREAA